MLNLKKWLGKEIYLDFNSIKTVVKKQNGTAFVVEIITNILIYDKVLMPLNFVIPLQNETDANELIEEIIRNKKSLHLNVQE